MTVNIKAVFACSVLIVSAALSGALARPAMPDVKGVPIKRPVLITNDSNRPPATSVDRLSGCETTVQGGGQPDTWTVKVGELSKTFDVSGKSQTSAEQLVLRKKRSAANFWAWNQCRKAPGARDVTVSTDGTKAAERFTRRTASMIRGTGCPVIQIEGAPAGQMIVAVGEKTKTFPTHQGNFRDFALDNCLPENSSGAIQPVSAVTLTGYDTEAAAFKNRCETEHTLKTHYDCACLSQEYLQQRKKLGPSVPESSIVLRISKSCPDASGARDYKFNRCMASSLKPASRLPKEQYCRCTSDKFKELYEAHSPGAGSKEARVFDMQAALACRG